MQTQSSNPARSLAVIALPLAVSLSGCAVVKGIFKAGLWTGVLAVVVVLALIVFGLRALVR